MAYAAITLLESGEGPIGNLDLMIVTQAVASSLMLVTRDAVFRQVKRLKVEDWSR